MGERALHANNMTFLTFLLLPWGFPSVSKRGLVGSARHGGSFLGYETRDPWRGCMRGAGRAGSAAALARSFARSGKCQGPATLPAEQLPGN